MIQSVHCPKCKKTANVPSHIQTMKCSKCGAVYNVSKEDDDGETVDDAASRAAGPMESGGKSKKGGSGKLIAGVLVGLLLVGGLVGGGYYWWSNQPETVAAAPVPATEKADEDDVVWTPPEYQEVDMPEGDRKRIYADMRIAAVKTIEKPLLLIGPPRTAMENLLQKTWDDEIQKQAALHDVKPDDIKQIVNEGDNKKWDPSPRSNAKRNGKRIYPKSWSVGWKQ